MSKTKLKGSLAIRAYLGVSESTFMDYVNTGELPVKKDKNSEFVATTKDLDKWRGIRAKKSKAQVEADEAEAKAKKERAEADEAEAKAAKEKAEADEAEAKAAEAKDKADGKK